MVLKENINSAHISKESRGGLENVERPVGKIRSYGAIGLFRTQEGDEVEVSRVGQNRSMV